MSEQSSDLREAVRQRYAAAAVQLTEGGQNFGSGRYGVDERDQVPAQALAVSSVRATTPVTTEQARGSSNIRSELW